MIKRLKYFTKHRFKQLQRTVKQRIFRFTKEKYAFLSLVLSVPYFV